MIDWWTNILLNIKTHVLEPLFKEDYLFWSTLIIATILIAMLVLIIVLSIKYKRVKHRYKRYNDAINIHKDKIDELSTKLFNETNRYFILDCTHKKQTEELLNLQSSIDDKEKEICQLKAKISDLMVYKKRSDSAKLAAQKRKENKQSHSNSKNK